MSHTKHHEYHKYEYDFEMPAVTVDCALFRHNKETFSPEVLLIKRRNEPYKDYWALPGGFIQKDEPTDECVHRELFEESSMKLFNNDNGIK